MTDAPERIWMDNDLDGIGWTPDHKEAMTTDIEYIRADLARPKVEPLEWQYTPGGDDAFASWRAPSVFGSYHVILYYAHISWTGPFCKARNLPSVNEAKSAAQADYERRILSALEGDY